MSDITDGIARNAGIGPQGTTVSANSATPGQEPVKRYAMPIMPNGRLAVPQVVQDGYWISARDYDRDIKALRELLLESKRSHFWVDEDCFYSCPKAPDYCGNEETDECTCGAEDWNAKVNAALKSTE